MEVNEPIEVESADGGEPSKLDVVLLATGQKVVPVIKAVRAITRGSLKEAKASVDHLPSVVARARQADEAKALGAALAGLGCEVELRESDGGYSTKELLADGDPGAFPADPSYAEEVAQLTKRVKNALRENLSQGEVIRVVIRGSQGQAIVGLDTRAFVLKPGFMAGATLGAEVTSFGYRNLAGVQVHKGMVSGSVILQTYGSAAQRTSYWGQSDDSPAKMPNAIPVGREWDHVKRGAARLRELIEAVHSPTSSAAEAPDQASLADEIAKLAELKAAGALSDEEFSQAKARLLGQ